MHQHQQTLVLVQPERPRLKKIEAYFKMEKLKERFVRYENLSYQIDRVEFKLQEKLEETQDDLTEAYRLMERNLGCYYYILKNLTKGLKLLEEKDQSLLLEEVSLESP